MLWRLHHNTSLIKPPACHISAVHEVSEGWRRRVPEIKDGGATQQRVAGENDILLNDKWQKTLRKR